MRDKQAMKTIRTNPQIPKARGRTALAILLCGAATLGTAPAQTPVAPARAAAPAPAAASATEEKVLTLREATQEAVLKNPEVLARFHGVKAAEGERDAARGGLYPRVDLQASAGPETRSTVDKGYTRSWTTLSLTQLLWDGRATQREVARLDHASRVRLFELLGTSEAVALEAVRAYFDVVRYRELVKLAEENFVEHRAVYSQTDQRVKAKIARAVDLEQITGRLALAEANLLIETANLHDTTARFQRIVGRLPSREMPIPTQLAQNLPGDVMVALTRTQEVNPAILASIENVRAANAALETRNSAYQPRLDFRLKRDQGRNLEGIPGNSNATTAEVVLNWNLFNGNADRARERQFAEQVNVARDVRDKTCRDLRQTTMIAFNDVVKLKEQIDYLTTHESSLTKALAAYRQQFQIGQRTLLDLLDTENELFQARRAVVNARQDLHIAQARTHSGIGNLIGALELSSLETGREEELRNWVAGADVSQQCPVQAVALYSVDKDNLVQRALQQVSRQAAETRAVQAAQSPAAAASAAAGTPGATPAPQTRAALAAQEKAVRAALGEWRDAWAKRDVNGYLRAYAPTFTPPNGMSREAWEKKRRAIIGKAKSVTLDLADVQVTLPGREDAQAAFTQNYRSDKYQDRVRKTLAWRLVEGRWQIVSETAEKQ